jgi:hypothetical protein
MNVFTKLPSVQGYGSLISTIYDDSTGTHPQSAVNPCRLADGTFTQLRLSAIAVSYAALSHNVNVPVRRRRTVAWPPASRRTATSDSCSTSHHAEHARTRWSPGLLGPALRDLD